MKRIQSITICLLACGAILFLAGCGKSAAPVAAVGNPAIEPAATVPAPTSTAPHQPAAAPAAAPAAEPTTDLAALTQVLRRYSMERRQVPQSLAEVVAAGYLKSLPAAPPGKKFAINAKRLEVVLVNL